MLPHRSLLTIALGGFLLALFALPGAQAQSLTAPTPSIDPETIDAIWQRASNKYDNQRAALLKQVDAADHHGPFRPDWESLQKYEVPEWYKDAKFGIFIHWGVYSVPAFGKGRRHARDLRRRSGWCGVSDSLPLAHREPTHGDR